MNRICRIVVIGMVSSLTWSANATPNEPAHVHEAAIQSAHRQIRSLGYCIIKKAAPTDFMAHARRFASALCETQSAHDKANHKSLGSLLAVEKDPGFVRLAFEPHVLSLLDRIANPQFRSPPKPVVFQEGIVFRKLPRSPKTFWHNDFPFWDDAAAATDPNPRHFTALWYLEGTTHENGALRVIPGSHVKKFPAIHDLWNVRSDAERIVLRAALRRGDEQDSPAFQNFPEEVSLPVEAGDLLLMDSRVLHGAHANTTDADRTALSLWYVSGFNQLAEGHQARIFSQMQNTWSKMPDDYTAHRERLPSYSGTAEPILPANIARFPAEDR